MKGEPYNHGGMYCSVALYYLLHVTGKVPQLYYIWEMDLSF